MEYIGRMHRGARKTGRHLCSYTARSHRKQGIILGHTAIVVAQQNPARPIEWPVIFLALSSSYIMPCSYADSTVLCCFPLWLPLLSLLTSHSLTILALKCSLLRLPYNSYSFGASTYNPLLNNSVLLVKSLHICLGSASPEADLDVNFCIFYYGSALRREKLVREWEGQGKGKSPSRMQSQQSPRRVPQDNPSGGAWECKLCLWHLNKRQRPEALLVLHLSVTGLGSRKFMSF